MWMTHVKAVVHDGGQAAYEAWKVMEGTAQRQAPGFIKRVLLRSQENPTWFYYQSFWHHEDQPAAFAGTERFQSLMREFGGPAQQAFAEPMLREDCHLVFDETAGPDVVADTSAPWVIHVSVVVHDEPENYERYKRWKVLEGTAQRHAPGFIKRLLVQSQERPNHFYYTSWWQSEAQAHGFSATDDFKTLFAAHSPVGVFAIPQVLEHCDIVFDEVAEPATD